MLQAALLGRFLPRDQVSNDLFKALHLTLLLPTPRRVAWRSHQVQGYNMLKMLRYLAVCSSAVLALMGPARAQVDAPDVSASRIAVSNSSGTVAAGTATATLPAMQGRYTYICGFSITSAGSTAAAVVAATVTNVVGGTMTYTYTSVAGATLANAPLVVNFTPCIPSTAVNTTVPVSLPSLGAGNTNATVSAWGYQWNISQ